MSKNESYAENSISVDKIISLTTAVTPNTLRTHHANLAGALSEICQCLEREKNNVVSIPRG